MVINPITVCSYGFLFDCMTVGQVSDSMTTMTLIGGSVPDVCRTLSPPWLNWGVFFSSDSMGVVNPFLVSSQFIK